MTGKILHRCTLCKKYHASYLVHDPQYGEMRLCHTCWKAAKLRAQQSSPEPDKLTAAQKHREGNE